MGQQSASIFVENVGVRYANGHTALYDVSFHLTGGMTCALVGVNGSGKSTLFKAIMGLVRPSAGEIKVAGLPIKQALKQNVVAYVPQSEEVDWQFPVSVYDVVMMGRYGHMGILRRPSAVDRQKVAVAMERVSISHLQDRQISELSGGQKKRVFLARALAQESKIILLDEPFTGVDVKTEKAIMELLVTLKDSGHLILVSTHNLGTIPEFCDQVVMINRTVLAVGATESTFTQANLQKVFGGVLRNIRLEGKDLHEDDDKRVVTILADDEIPAVFYGVQAGTPEHDTCPYDVAGADSRTSTHALSKQAQINLNQKIKAMPLTESQIAQADDSVQQFDPKAADKKTQRGDDD